MVASISAVPTAAAGASYYGKDNYYAPQDNREPTAWMGKGTERLGLSGSVDIETFEQILEGQTLDGRKVGQRDGESLDTAMERKHRPGIDMTFSPPKDVSLLLYLGGDKRLLTAHREAVTESLKWVEKNLAGARIRRGNAPAIPVKTSNLVVATFQHDISRDKDPQLHTHSVIANMTHAEGKWRALHNDPIFAHAKLASLSYDASMREKVRELGYQVHLKEGKTGEWSIKGVPEAAKAEFSQRSEKIKAAAETLDHNTPKSREKLALKTRPSKTEMTRDERIASWQARGAEWIPDLKSVVSVSMANAKEGLIERPLNNEEPEQSGLSGMKTRFVQQQLRPTKTLRLEPNDPYRAREALSERAYAARAAVSFGIRHMEEREAAFSLHHVRRKALEHGADGLTLKDVDRELRSLRARKLVRVNARDPNAESTTARSITHEERTKTLVQTAGKTKPLVPEIALADRLKEGRLTNDQRGAIMAILGGENRLVGIQGYAGTGKTTMMRRTGQLAQDMTSEAKRGGYSILGLAPTHSARGELERSTGFETKSVQRFLIDLSQGQRPKDISNTIVIVDESSFLSTKSMNIILERLIALNPARIVLAGDKRQHGAVEAGRPFEIAQRSGMRTAIMTDIVRLPKDVAHADLRGSVEAAATGQVQAAMRRIAANTIERPEPDGLVKGVVDAWKSLPDAKRNDALIVAPGHRIRTEINTAVRNDLIDNGYLGASATRHEVYQVQDTTHAEAMSPRSFNKGDLLVFHAWSKSVNARKHDTRRVIDIDEEKGMITIANAHGREQTVSIERLHGRRDFAPFSINRDEEIELRPNDKLIFTKSDQDKNIAAMDMARVVSFDEKTLTLDVHGEQREFARDDPAVRHLSHAYAVTSHASQGKTANDVITVIDSNERMLTSQVGFYVSISRTADTLTVIVDDKEQVLDRLERNTGLKSSALDAVQRMETLTGLDRDAVEPTVKENVLEQEESTIEKETEQERSIRSQTEENDAGNTEAEESDSDNEPVIDQGLSL